jgi:xanthine/CO dehydrogenase XdhC/CoxF family maturation factor
VTTHRAIVDELTRASAAEESVVLATVVRVTGSSYGGVGARMLIRVDGSTVGLVSGGCLESDLAEHARRVHETDRAEVVRYDTRDDEDAPWGLGLGCNGLIDVLLEPLQPARAKYFAKFLCRALEADRPSVLATVIRVALPAENTSFVDTSTILGGDSEAAGAAPSVGAHALFTGNRIEKSGEWGGGNTLARATADIDEALNAGRRGLYREYGPIEVAFEVVAPAVRLVICGSGPDVIPIARFGAELGWDVTVVDHRPVDDSHKARFPAARIVECPEASHLGDAVTLTPGAAGVVMSHHISRDTDYVDALLKAGAAYIGVLGPRARTERMLADLSARTGAPITPGGPLFAPVGIDIGGEGPDSIALAIVAEISAVMSGRSAGHLRDKRGPLHGRAT